MDGPLDLLAANARDLARGLVAQLPFLAVAAAVFVAFLLLGRLLRRVVRQALRRHDPAFADVVTDDGRLVVASEAEHPDLLWAIRAVPAPAEPARIGAVT